MNQIGDFTAIISLALVAVFFTLLLVSGNTMAQSVNERIGELAVLKTLGFKDMTLFFLIIGESMTITFIGGYVGLALSSMAIPEIVSLSGNLLTGMMFSFDDVLWGSLCMALVAIVSSIVPAIKAMRIKIVDGLEGTL
jgi:putative ABC transport system permease protein